MVDLPIWPSADYPATEDRWEQMVSTWFEDGIVSKADENGMPIDGQLRPYGDSSGMFAKVTDGSGLLRGFFSRLAALETLPIEAADSLPRWDRIMLKLVTGGSSAKMTIYVKKGTPAALTTIPNPEISDTVRELPIGRVYVGAGVITIRAQDVVDERIFSAPVITAHAGTVQMFYGTSNVPRGWLPMQGQTVLTAQFPALARQWGVQASTFMTIPDMSGLVARGISSSLGNVGGDDLRTLTTYHLPAHDHGFSGTWSGGNHGHSFAGDSHSHGVSDGGHNHGVNDPGHLHGIGGDTGYRIVVTASSATRLATGSTPGAANEVSWTRMDAASTGISLNGSGANIGINAASVSGTVGASGTLSGSVSGSVASNGAGNAFEIIPRHRQLLYIIKAH